MPPRLGSYVRGLRLNAGLTQQQTADLAGMSIAALRDLEQGRIAAPRPATLRRLAEGLRLPPPDLELLIRRGQPGRFPAENLWLEVLGPVAVHVEGEPVTVGSARQRLLLAALAVSPNTPISQERLIEMIWGNRPPTNVGELLRNDCARLRRRLPRAKDADGAPDLVVTAGTYQLTIAANQLDLLLFRRLVAQARAAREVGDPYQACHVLAEALTLWRGEPLADLTILRDDPAVLGLEREWHAGVVEYAETAIRFGRYADVLPLLRRLVERDPLHEAASALLLMALTAAGEAGTALAVFDQLRTRLAEDFGTDPGPELLKAYQAAQEQRHPGIPGSAAAVRRQLPADLAEFTGRAAELRSLRAGLAAISQRSTAVPAASIVGTAGAGKTCLAVHLAHQLLAAGEYPDLQLHVELGDVDPSAALAALLGLLGVPADQVPPDLASRTAVYRDRLAGRRALVLLDDVASEEQVWPLVPADPANLVLITSRQALALDGMQVLSLGALPPADAERLLARVAGPRRTTGDPAATRRLLELCDHLPLAISLAARRLRARPTWSTAGLADQLARATDRLRELAAGTDQLHTSFARSYRALPDPERRLFRLLGADSGPELTVCATAAMASLPARQARQLLDRLADASLLSALSDDRYRLSPLLRDYARSLPRQPPGPVRPPADGVPAGPAGAHRYG